MGAVVVDKPESMNLLGLILQSLLERNLADEGKARRGARLRGSVGVQAGRMQVTLRCQQERFTIVRGIEDPIRAWVRGGLESFLAISLGGGLISPVLSGRVKIGGNPLFLLKMLPLLRVPVDSGV